MNAKAAISWSGGKDSCAALLRARADYDIVAMVTMVDETAARSRSHGLRPEVLDAQAVRLGLDRWIGRCTWATYDREYAALLDAVAQSGITHIVFGDIVFPEHRDWAERMCAARGLIPVEPLFGLPTDRLFREWVDGGNDAIIVTARAEHLDASWLGRRLCLEMVPEFERLGVDPCGERGEYHTMVTNCPLFSAPIEWVPGQVVERGGCWALDISLA